MHFPAPHLHRKSVAKLVKGFQKGKDQPEDHQVAGRQNAVGDVFGQLRPVQTSQKNTIPYHNQPYDGPGPTEYGSYQRQKKSQNPLRIK